MLTRSEFVRSGQMGGQGGTSRNCQRRKPVEIETSLCEMKTQQHDWKVGAFGPTPRGLLKALNFTTSKTTTMPSRSRSTELLGD